MKLTEKELKKYIDDFPEYMINDIEKACIAVKEKYGKLDLLTVDYYLKPKEYGGLNYGNINCARCWDSGEVFDPVAGWVKCPECQS